jgi:phage-related protein
VVFSVTGVLGSSIKDRTVRTSVREVKVPYSQMNSTMQSILRSGAKIVNVSVIP